MNESFWLIPCGIKFPCSCLKGNISALRSINRHAFRSIVRQALRLVVRQSIYPVDRQGVCLVVRQAVRSSLRPADRHSTRLSYTVFSQFKPTDRFRLKLSHIYSPRDGQGTWLHPCQTLPCTFDGNPPILGTFSLCFSEIVRITHQLMPMLLADPRNVIVPASSCRLTWNSSPSAWELCWTDLGGP